MVVAAVVAVARSGEERKLETSASYSSFELGGGADVAAALEEEEVAEGCFDCGISRLQLSPLEGGAGRDETLLLPLCAWLCTDEVLAGCTRGTDGVFEGAGKGVRISEVPGSFFTLT